MKNLIRENTISAFIIAVLLLTAILDVKAGGMYLYDSTELSSSQINCICQDRYGYIWVGTEYGLNRFDGYTFVQYLHDSNDAASLGHNIVSTLYCDSEGDLWVGLGGGLDRYDYGSDKFVHMKFAEGKFRGNAISENKEGTLYVGTAGNGLLRVNKKENTVEQVPDRTGNEEQIFFTRLYIDSRGLLWRGSHMPEFSIYNIQDGALMRVQNFKLSHSAPPIFIEYDNKMFIVCPFGISTYDYATGQVTDFGLDMSGLGPDALIRRAIVNSNGDLLLATRGSGLKMVKKHDRKVIDSEYPASFGLNSLHVNAIFEDRDQNLWLGCYHKGLMLLNGQEGAFKSWGLAERTAPKSTCVLSIIGGDHGETLCTVENDGLYHLDSLGNIISKLNSPNDTRIIYRDQNRNYWLCTEKTLYRFDVANETYSPVLNARGWGFNCILDDCFGNLYVSNNGSGLIVYNTHSGNISHHSMNLKAKNGIGLRNDWVQSMVIDKDNLLWIGGADGLECLNTKTQEFVNLGSNPPLKGLQCTAISILKSGEMIVCTDKGVYTYNKNTGATNELSGSNPYLTDKNICGVITDDKGDLWFSTSNGIWQYDTNTHRMIGHISGNGLVSNEYITTSLCHYADDRIAFGTPKGITTFYPEAVKNIDNSDPFGEIILTSLTANGRNLDVTSDRIVLPANENTLRMTFSMMNFKHDGVVAYQWRIGNSGKWTTTASDDNSLSLVNLAPGTYNIEIRGYINGEASPQTKNVVIEVRNPWYTTIWAYFAYVTLIAAALYVGYRFYNKKRKEVIAEEKMRFLINATHDIRTPLTLIMGPLQKLHKRAEQNGWLDDTATSEDFSTIERNTKHLLALVNQILDKRKFDKGQMAMRYSSTDIISYIEGIVKLYDYNARERNIRLVFAHEDDDIQVWIDRTQFDKVISNLLSNAFKYTPSGGEVDIKVDRIAHSADADEGMVRITITDNGTGFKGEDPEKLFRRFYQGRPKLDYPIQGSGIGLDLCKEIVTLHHGTITASERHDGVTGACFVITIPLGNKHIDEKDLQTAPETPDNVGTGTSFPKVLVVDDNEELGRYIMREMADWYKFDYSPNGKEALKQLLSKEYDLVISDVMMPEMDGLTLLRHIKGNANISHIPVILLTSQADVSDRLEGIKKGADAFLSKPFDMEELHVLVENLIENVRRLKGKFSGAQAPDDKIESKDLDGNNARLMQRIINCINAQINNSEFNVEQLSLEVGVSRAHLHRKMKEMTGISASEFIRNIRLKQAAKLLRENKVNVTQVAYHVGFTNVGHFSTVFKKFYGVTPSEYAEGKGKDFDTTAPLGE